MLIATTNEVPGFRVVDVYGDVFGLTVRARNYTESRNEARERLMEAARQLGANAVVATRFDCNQIGGIMSEIAAYGTAVTIIAEVPVPAAATA